MPGGPTWDMSMQGKKNKQGKKSKQTNKKEGSQWRVETLVLDSHLF